MIEIGKMREREQHRPRKRVEISCFMYLRFVKSEKMRYISPSGIQSQPFDVGISEQGTLDLFFPHP
jgi:hypothetical protein